MTALRILVLGARGQLGQAAVEGLAGRGHDVSGRSRQSVDVTVAAQVRAAIAEAAPHAILNCAAYNNVDQAEREPVRAFDGNALAVRTLARAAADAGVVLVHFGTDFVFDGTADRPYTEDDAPNPRSAYATSKLLGEWFAAETPRHYVLRVESLFGGPRRESSVDRMLAGIERGEEVRAFGDRTVSPSYVVDVVNAVATLLEGGRPYGLYHCVNSGWTTWTAVAREIARIAGAADARIVETRMADAPLIAQRPLFAALSNAKLAAAGVAMPTWQDALTRYITQR